MSAADARLRSVDMIEEILYTHDEALDARGVAEQIVLEVGGLIAVTSMLEVNGEWLKFGIQLQAELVQAAKDYQGAADEADGARQLTIDGGEVPAIPLA